MGRAAHHEPALSVAGVLVMAVEHDGDGAGVVDSHVHVLLEAAGTDRETGLTGEVHAVFEETRRLVRGGGGGEIRAAAMTGIGEEGELADEEEAPVYVNRGEIELVIGVREDTKVDDLAHDVVGIPLSIAAGDADEHDQTRPDAARLLPGDGHAGPADALHEGFHAAVLLASEGPDDEESEPEDLEEEPGEPDEPDEEASR